MSLLAAVVCLAAKPSRFDAALTWAKRLEPAGVYQDGRTWSAKDALEAYERLQVVFGPRDPILEGKARCYEALGRDSLAFASYMRMLKPDAQRLQEVRDRLRVRAEVQPILPKGEVCILVSRVRSKTWVIVSGEPVISAARYYGGVRIRLFTDGRGTGPAKMVLSKSEDEEYPISSECLLVRTLASGGVVIAFLYSEPSNDPTSGCDLFTVIGNRLRSAGHLRGCYVAATATAAKLVLRDEETYKFYWPDIYDFDGSSLRLANWKHPEQYPKFELGLWPDETEFANWLWIASEYAIHRDWRGAERALRRANYLCRQAIAAERHPEPGYTDYPNGFCGDAKENLKEIRQRLRWIARHNYNHALLYRPYDSDLQVPPYKLGRAGDNR